MPRSPVAADVLNFVKKFLAALLLAALLVGALHLPADDRLELYDVDEMVYTFNDFPSIDLDPPPVYADVLVTGMELADQLRWLVPGSDRTVQFQNGLLIVRATAIQHTAVRIALTARRLRNSCSQKTAVAIYHLKTTLPKKLFGMITT